MFRFLCWASGPVDVMVLGREVSLVGWAEHERDRERLGSAFRELATIFKRFWRCTRCPIIIWCIFSRSLIEMCSLISTQLPVAAAAKHLKIWVIGASIGLEYGNQRAPEMALSKPTPKENRNDKRPASMLG